VTVVPAVKQALALLARTPLALAFNLAIAIAFPASFPFSSHLVIFHNRGVFRQLCLGQWPSAFDEETTKKGENESMKGKEGRTITINKNRGWSSASVSQTYEAELRLIRNQLGRTELSAVR